MGRDSAVADLGTRLTPGTTYTGPGCYPGPAPSPTSAKPKPGLATARTGTSASPRASPCTAASARTTSHLLVLDGDAQGVRRHEGLVAGQS